MHIIPKLIVHSWQLMKACVSFLANHKHLMILPIKCFISIVCLLILFLVGFIVSIVSSNYGSVTEIAIILTALYYLCLSFVTMYFNTTLINCTVAGLQGKSTTINDAISQTQKHIPQLLGWSLMTCIVSLIISWSIATTMGYSWALYAYFVSPMLVLGNVAPLTTFKRSVHKFKRNWHQVVGINLIFSLYFLAILIIFYGLTLILGAIPMSAVKLTIIMVSIALLLMTFSVTLGSVANCAIYLYLMQSIKTPYFDSDLLSKFIKATDRNFLAQE